MARRDASGAGGEQRKGAGRSAPNGTKWQAQREFPDLRGSFPVIGFKFPAWDQKFPVIGVPMHTVINRGLG